MTNNVKPIINKLQILFFGVIMRDVNLMKLIYTDCIINCGREINGRYVEEATNVFEMRVKACQERREDHLHVYFLSCLRKLISESWGRVNTP